MDWLILSDVDPISGGAGWIGAGLLGSVLAWLLLKHLPEKDRQTKELIDGYSETIKTLHTDCAAERRDLSDRFETAIDKICDRHRKDKDEVIDFIVRVKDSFLHSLELQKPKNAPPT